MRILVLMFFLAGMSCNVMAKDETVEVGKGFGGNRAFAYTDSMHKLGGDVIMWDLLNASTPQNLSGHSPYLSMVSQVQYSCEKKRTRTLFINYWSQKDGKGDKILFVDNSTLLDWKPVQSGTAQEALFKFACDKK